MVKGIAVAFDVALPEPMPDDGVPIKVICVGESTVSMRAPRVMLSPNTGMFGYRPTVDGIPVIVADPVVVLPVVTR